MELKLRGAGYRVRVARIGAAPVPGRHRRRRRQPHAADVEIERFDEHTGRIVVNGTASGWSPTPTARST